MTQTINVHNKTLFLDKPKVMGILNVTPDSFYSGSRKQTEEEIALRVQQIVREGGSIVDVGAFSTRPGAPQVSEEEELLRMRKGLEVVTRELEVLRTDHPNVMVSIDTFRPAVARMAVEEYGADIINDVSEGGITGVVDTPMLENIDIFREVARLKVPYILMSVQPTLEAMVSNYLKEISQLRALGVQNVILDPGYGFGKDIVDGNFSLLSCQQQLKDVFHLPLLVGVSRKRMIWQCLGSSPEEALNGTTVVNVMALERGADILRVHDVKEASEAVALFEKLKNNTR